MKTINIKGKEYVPVVERVKEFHRLHPQGQITTEALNIGSDRIVVKATVSVPKEWKSTHGAEGNQLDAKVSLVQVFTGHSQAVYSKGMMGDVALEVAETSAVGRALGFANIGLIDGIASADEMRKVNAKDVPVAEDDLDF